MKPRSGTVLVSGVAAMDFVFFIDEMPRRAEKYKTGSAVIQGGGGGANAAAAVATLGGRSLFAGRRGADPVGDMVLADLTKFGVDCRHLACFPDARSSFASIYVDRNGERQIMSYRDPAMPTDPAWLGEAASGPLDAILCDTRWPDGALTLMDAAARRGIPGVIDVEAPARPAREAIMRASHAAFSAQGLRDWSGHDDLRSGLAGFANESGKFACVTNGAEGVYWHHAGQSGHVPAFDIVAVDTLGAGDVWHAAFALMIAEGLEPVSSMRFANAAAAIKCSRTGGRAACPDRAEVQAFLKRA